MALVPDTTPAEATIAALATDDSAADVLLSDWAGQVVKVIAAAVPTAAKGITIEIEWRFSYPDVDGGVSYLAWRRVRQRWNFPAQATETTIVLYPDDLRTVNGVWYRKRSLPDPNDKRSGRDDKQGNGVVQLEDFGVKFALSTEEKVPAATATPLLTRRRKRWTVKLDNNWQLDVTHVKETYAEWQKGVTYRKNSRVRYGNGNYKAIRGTSEQPTVNRSGWVPVNPERWEVELERSTSNIAKLTAQEVIERVEEVLSVLWESNIAVRWSERSAMLKFLGSQFGRELDSLLSRPISLTLPELVSIDADNPNYRLTPKADGQRVLLVVDATGLWQVTEGAVIDTSLVRRLPRQTGLVGLVLEAERVRSNRDGSIIYLVYDCLGQPSAGRRTQRRDVRNENHAARMVAAVVNLQLLRPIWPEVNIRTKDLRAFASPEEFFGQVNQLLDREKMNEYPIDGLLLVPTGRYTDARIYKWKPPNRQTVDFWLREVRDESGKSVQYFPLVSDGNAFHNDPVVLSPEFTYQSTTVYECAWIAKSVDARTGKLIPGHWITRLERLTKATPNARKVADAVWALIERPLDEDTMRGRSAASPATTAFAREATRRLSRQLLEVENNRPYTLLDLGSGRGGDIASFSRYSQVYAVEPSADNIGDTVDPSGNVIEGLQSRVEGMRARQQARNLRQTNVDIIQARAEDTELILPHVRERVDVVSFVNTWPLILSGGTTALVGALRTALSCLKPGGKIVWVCPDGDKVLNFLRTFTTVNQRTKTVDEKRTVETYFANDIGTWSMTRTDLDKPRQPLPPNTTATTVNYDVRLLTVNLYGTIVGVDQVEALVFFDAIRYLLENEGFSVAIVPAPNAFMTLQENTFYNVNATGTARWTSSIIPLSDQTPELYTWQGNRRATQVAVVSPPLILPRRGRAAIVIAAPVTPLQHEISQRIPFVGADYFRVGMEWSDKSSIFHALFAALSTSYRESRHKQTFVYQVRQWLARRALDDYPTYRDNMWPRQAQHFQAHPEDVYSLPPDYQAHFNFSVKSIVNNLQPGSDLSPALFDYLATLYSVHIIVVRFTIYGEIVHDFRSETDTDRAIVLSTGGPEFEQGYRTFDLIGLEDPPASGNIHLIWTLENVRTAWGIDLGVENTAAEETAEETA